MRRRVDNCKADALSAIGTSSSLVRVSLEDYLEILRWIIASESSGGLTAPASVESVLKQSGRSSADWVSWMRSQRLKRRAYGNAQAVKDYTDSTGQFWVKQ